MIYKRYVDDIFVLIPSKEPLQPFVNYMNKQNKCLKFTSEAEGGNCFSILDIKLPVLTNIVKYLLIENQL